MPTAAADFDFESNGVRVRITGLRKTIRAMEAAGTSAESMKDLMHTVGLVVVAAARPQAPVLSGVLAGDIRAGRGKTKAVVRAGRASVPYAGVQHYGWPARNIAATNFLTNAVQGTRSQTFQVLDDGIGQLLREQQLI